MYENSEKTNYNKIVFQRNLFPSISVSIKKENVFEINFKNFYDNFVIIQQIQIFIKYSLILFCQLLLAIWIFRYKNRRIQYKTTNNFRLPFIKILFFSKFLDFLKKKNMNLQLYRYISFIILFIKLYWQ